MGKHQKLSGVYPRKTLVEKLKMLLHTKDIVILTGLRRIGKTTAMRMLIEDLIDNEEVNPTKIFYMSLDDYLLTGKSIIEIVDEYRKCHKIKFEEKVFLFFDEVVTRRF